MARWLLFFADYNFRVEYKPGKLNVLANALSRRPDYELAHVSWITTDLYDRIRLAYQEDENYTPLVQFLSDGKDAKRVKPSDHASAPLQSLPVPADCWKSMSLDFVFGLPADDKGNTGILVFVYRLSKMAHLAPTIVSDRDPPFTGAFWETVFQLLGTNICAEAPRSMSDLLPMVEFALNNVVHASTWFTPFYLNGSVESNKLKHRFIGPFAALARHGAAYTIDLPKSMATHPTFYVGRLKRYHDPLGLPSQTEEDQGENSPPRNEDESSGQPELPVSKPVTDTQAGTHESHTNGTTVQSEKSSASTEFLQGGSRNSAVNVPMELVSLTNQSVHVLTEDLKGSWLASLRGSLTTRSQPKGYLDRVHAIPKLTDLVARQGSHSAPTRS
ncbi:Pol protein [Phytophthora palmivora]|uniref:Pol protein n=1 Tax=Phytophthora palmivora TaxID=4796 RepID=A0A2P4YLU0_9STRA|nr:Pol protein [Phytophthora palmivora]